MTGVIEGKSDVIGLKDGRRLGFAEYGDRQGAPLLYFHGWPSSRLEGELVAAEALKGQIRLIVPDRPGFGLSDFKPDRRLVDWPDDVLELAEALGVERFAILGPSGGGPYAAVCAWKIPDRLDAVGIVSGMSPLEAPGVLDSMRPLNRRLAQIGRLAPWLARPLAWQAIRSMKRDPDRYFERQLADLPEPDRAIMARPEVRRIMLGAALEAFRQGAGGVALENGIYARPWGFRLQEIILEIQLWHGELDKNTPPAMGRYMAKTVPNCQAQFWPNEGHISLFVNQMEAILRALTSGGSGGPEGIRPNSSGH